MALQQPNFALVSTRLTEAGQELALCANMPSVREGQGILDSINALTMQIQQNHREMQQNHREMQQNLQGMQDNIIDLTRELRARVALSSRTYTSSTKSPTMLPFLSAIERLKTTPRAGWVKKDVPNPESDSPTDRIDAVNMALFHDAPEAICGDVTPSDGVSRETKRQREELGAKFLACLARPTNPAFAVDLMDHWEAYDSDQTHVSRIVHQVDKLEALNQAYIYSMRHPNLDLGEFRGLRAQVKDPWLSRIADDTLRAWDDLEARATSGFAWVLLLREEQKRAGSQFSGFITDSFEYSVPVPSFLAMELLSAKMEAVRDSGKRGIILDGFPRSVEQLDAFEEQITRTYSTISFECPSQVLTERLLGRAETSGREDDAPDAIRKELRLLRKAMPRLMVVPRSKKAKNFSCESWRSY
ncbi:unnamed protein product [Parascedosporium putredinis]|uniref:HD domain-containing protein n=1 Tax=Parascedosporium putredinis TaxID=1442378 RepID=A0A9P1GZN1_9PEZI|nr:unnamed protein product [Parascedosporium putredinis]CAI7993034.1 unnamed protein product [Parascedosporium putredinis]